MDESRAERSAKPLCHPSGEIGGNGGGIIRAAAALLAAALVAGGCSTASKSFLLHPQPPAAKEYSMTAGALVYRDQKAEVEVRPLDPRFVKECLAAEGRANPFILPGEAAPSPLIFEVRLRNEGKRSLYFNPSQARGLDNDKNRYYPLGFAEFYQLHREDAEGEERLKTFKALCYDGPVELKPGGEITRYLPMFAAESAPKTLAVTLPLVYDGKEPIAPTFVFEGFPVEEEKKP